MKKTIFALILTFSVSLSFAEGIGLVLSGGGAKGAYEVGVWKAMEDFGLTKKTKIISGTSVGALNAALFATTSVKDAISLWKNEVGFSSFLMPDSDSMESLASSVMEDYNNEELLRHYAVYEKEKSSSLQKSELNSLKKYLNQFKDATMSQFEIVMKLMTDYLFSDKHTEGLFERGDLIRIMDQYISLEKINSSNIDVYATAVRKSNLAGKLALRQLALMCCLEPDDNSDTFLLNEQISSENIKNILLASSAMPIVYSSQMLAADTVINGQPLGKEWEYYDGGFTSVGGQNTPINPVIMSDKVDTLFVVYLSSYDELRSNSHDEEKIYFECDVNDKKLVSFIPSEDLGDMIEGTVNFSNEKIIQMMKLGYKDACNVLKDAGYKQRKRIFKSAETKFLMN